MEAVVKSSNYCFFSKRLLGTISPFGGWVTKKRSNKDLLKERNGTKSVRQAGEEQSENIWGTKMFFSAERQRKGAKATFSRKWNGTKSNDRWTMWSQNIWEERSNASVMVGGGPDVTKYQSSNNFNRGIENIYYFGTSNTLYPLRD